jgi:hypothetical protein
MNNLIYTKTYSPPPVDEREALRYAGVKEKSDEITALLQDCIKETADRMTYKVCYGEFEISCSGDELDLTFAKVNSRLLAKNLRGCHKIVLFCATVGVEMDRLIAKYATLSPAKSLMLDALGSERVEAVCDLFNAEITERARGEGCKAHPRFSPGYGDLPLDIQREIFAVLNPEKRIGVVLNDNLFMSPSKSVTAIIGIEKDN